MKKITKYSIIVRLGISVILVAVPLFVYNHYNQERKANEQAIANDRTEIRNLKQKRRQKLTKIYQRQENIKQLNQRLHTATNTMLHSQRILQESQLHKVDPEKLDQATTELSKITAQNLALPNSLVFNYGKKPLTLAVSYPSQFNVNQDTIPVIMHAYDKNQKEIAFAVLHYDPNDHVFAQVDNYSVSRQEQQKQSKGQGTDYQSYLKKKRALAKRSQQKAVKKPKAKKAPKSAKSKSK